MSGFVSLVGAGPGDPELLTLKAMRALQQSDLVLYDALVAPESLGFAYRAQRFFVGKRAGRPSITQETINKLMIRAARRGKRVVRLKCGDPFVLGRGGEEGLALLEAGIPFEVVPGLSSALAGPALSGIPVTHRGLASGFLVLSGHSPTAYQPVLETLAPGSVTLVVLMGLGRRAELAQLLIERGWRRDLPAAVALAASTPRATTWVGTLETLGSATVADPDAPGILVVGETVSLAAALAPAALAAGSRHQGAS